MKPAIDEYGWLLAAGYRMEKLRLEQAAQQIANDPAVALQINPKFLENMAAFCLQLAAALKQED